MKNNLLLSTTAVDIEGQIDKILRGLGHPEPPLNLDDVRTLLRLDRQYYSTTNTGWVDTAVSRLTIATKQVLARPTLLLEAITKRLGAWIVQPKCLPLAFGD